MEVWSYMKRIILVAALLGFIGTAAYGAAATLAVGGGTLASGATAAACDTNVDVEYVLNGSGNVDSVVVTGIAAGCTGQDVIVTTDGDTGGVLDGVCANIIAGTTTATVGLTANQPGGPINGVAVTIASTNTANANCTAS